jgi:glycosyltransferase involved in cell wall biosynthesis
MRARTLRRYAAGAPVALFATQGRRHSLAVRLAARLFAPTVCVAQSRATVAQARALGWRALAAPPAVDTALFHPAGPDEKRGLRAAFGLPPDAVVALHAGHLSRSRGVADLLALAPVALPVLVASTSTPQDTELAADLRAGGAQVITRYLPDIADLYRAADVYLFPVPPDPFAPSSIDAPLSVIEALSCGLPVIARRFGMLPELWPDTPGVCFYDEPSQLPAALTSALRHSASTRPLVDAFTWEAVARRLAEVAR